MRDAGQLQGAGATHRVGNWQRSCVSHALLVSRSQDPSYHLRVVLALELDPEPLNLFCDCELVIFRHFSRTVDRLAR